LPLSSLRLWNSQSWITTARQANSDKEFCNRPQVGN
jgi:hypothetical protein